MLRNKGHEQTNESAFNPVGVGDISGTAIVPPDPTPAPGSAIRRDEHSLEFSARDTIRWNDRLATWFGVRHTRLDRSSLESDSGAAGYLQSFNTAWGAVSYKFAADAMAYVSWGQGVESAVVPNNIAVYTNPGAVLPALKSKQWELGAKGAHGAWSWQVDTFDIHRPITNLDTCSADDDLFLRLLSALAAAHWPANAREEERIQRFLQRLASDDGRGEEKYVERMEKNIDTLAKYAK